jgi:hypothetical protein
MTLQAIVGGGLWLPRPGWDIHSGTAPSQVASVIDATGEKCAWSGRVWNKDRATKDITKVGFLCGTITSAGGSGLTLSLQNVDTATGNPMRPDETQDQTVSFLASALTTGTWFQTAALSADRTVTYGELLSVVLEYDGSGRLGSDAVNVLNITVGSSPQASFDAVGALKTGGSWAAVAVKPNIILEFDDGTFGTLDGAFPCANITNVNVTTGSTPDEWALKFQVPFPCKVDGCWVQTNTGAAGRDFSMLLSDGGGALQTVSVDAETGYAYSYGTWVIPIPETTLSANTDYYLSWRPDTASNTAIGYFDMNAANHFQAHEGGPNFRHTNRTNGGAWAAETTTRRPLMGIRISALDDGTGGGSTVAGVIGS